MTSVSVATMPKIESVILERSLYDWVPVPANALNWMMELRYGQPQFDAHCIHCDRDSTFRGAARSYVPGDSSTCLNNGYFDGEFICARNGAHRYKYFFAVLDKKVCKVGQYPSLEDIAGSDLKRFRSDLGQDNFAELRRATGLFAHGIGVGSFVYLRRIFETLIAEHATAAKIDMTGMRMDERISALAAHLPPALVKHSQIYSVLSKGIHELTEKECLAYFPVIKKAIVLILEQHLQARAAARSERELQEEVSKIVQQIAAPS